MGCHKISATLTECCQPGPDICNLRDSSAVAKQTGRSFGEVVVDAFNGLKSVLSGQNSAEKAKSEAK